MRIQQQFASFQIQATVNSNITRVKQPVSAPIVPSYNCAPPAGLDKLFGRVAPAKVGPQGMIDQLSQQANKLVQDMIGMLQGAGNQSGPSFGEWFDDLMGQATQPTGRCGNVFQNGIPQPPQNSQQPCGMLQDRMNGQSLEIWQKVFKVLQDVLDLLRSLLGQGQNTQCGMKQDLQRNMKNSILRGPSFRPVPYKGPKKTAPKTEAPNILRGPSFRPVEYKGPKKTAPEAEAPKKTAPKTETEAPKTNKCDGAKSNPVAPKTNKCDGVKPAPKKPAAMDFKGACEILDKHFGVLDQAAGIGPRDGIISRLDLHAILSNPGAPKELKQAARFFLDNPAYFGKADGATALFGIRDGLISRADLRKQL